MRGPDFTEIRTKLIDRLDALVRELVPGGKRSGKYWIARNPTRDDRHAGSFWVLMSGPAAGAWRDEAGIRGVDEGDVVRLVQYCRGLPDMSATRAECLKWLGERAFSGQAPAPRARPRAPRDDEAEERRRRATGGERALGLWLKADRITPANLPGSIVDHYFMTRGLDLMAAFVARRRELPGALRFFPAHDYHCADADGATGELIALPCIAALMTGPTGKPQALHRTWLAPDGGGKARLPDPKFNAPRKILGPPRGAVIRIAKGAGNHTPEEAERRGISGPLILTEGIEDALAVAIALPGRRVWAAGTLGNIASVPVLPCVSSITVCADNDEGKPQAIAALERAVTELRKSGRPVHVHRPPRWAKDMNDVLKGERV